MKKQTSITLDQEVYDRIDEMAKENGLQFSPFLNMLLIKYLKSLEQSK